MPQYRTAQSFAHRFRSALRSPTPRNEALSISLPHPHRSLPRSFRRRLGERWSVGFAPTLSQAHLRVRPGFFAIAALYETSKNLTLAAGSP